MIYYSLFDISILEPSDVEMMREKIRGNFSNNVNIKSVESVVSKALLCMLLRRQFGIRDFYVDCDKNGKPFIVDSKISFNLSHSGSYVMCVCADENVGCDIQQIKPYNDKVAKRFFTKCEYEALEKCEDKAYAFTVMWTLKESALKFSGEGISGGLDRYDFSAYYDKKWFTADGMHFVRTDLEDYVFTICCSDTTLPSDIDNNVKNNCSEVKGEFYEHL